LASCNAALVLTVLDAVSLSLLRLVSEVSANAWAVLVIEPVTSLPTVAVTTIVTALVAPTPTSPSWQMLLTHVP